MRFHHSILCHLSSVLLCLALLLPAARLTAQQAREIRQFKVAAAKQAVAVDKHFFYVINNSTITKHRKEDGVQVAIWDGIAAGIIKHLNSGVVINGKLYCANSNFPESPMASSVEIFDVNTMQHIGNHSLGIAPQGSLTWVDQKDGYWWAGFAHYNKHGASEGKDNRWTTLIKFSKDWQQLEAWIFPKNLIEKFGTMSNSGGAWGNDGLLYCTGHDNPELYVLKLPETGYTLTHLATVPVGIYGQGIAVDHTIKGVNRVYGLSRADSTIVLAEIKAE